MIYFNGRSSEELGVYVESYPVRTIPRRKTEIISIDGRSGDIIIPQEAFENVMQEYDIYISAKKKKLHTAAHAVAEWLMQSGYKRLEDSYDPEVYRMACYTGGEEIESFLDEFGRATITFNAMPQRWLKEGEKTLTVSKGMTLRNPTAYPAKPLIKVTGSGNGTLTVGGTTVTLTGINQFIMLDSEIMDAYKGTENCNSKMSGQFPELAGNSVITWTGGITAVEITPRWYSL